MRTYGRVKDKTTKQLRWVQVDTTDEGFDDYVWVTTLIQSLKLNLGESPFYANYGIPAKQSVLQQVQPDFYTARAQQQFAPYFANLLMAREPGDQDQPSYRVNITLHSGLKLTSNVKIAA